MKEERTMRMPVWSIVFISRRDTKPGGRWCVGVQSFWQPHLHQPSNTGRSRVTDVGISGTSRSLPEHLQCRQGSICSTLGFCWYGPCGSQLSTHQFCKRLGAQLLTTRSDSVSLLVGSAPCSLQVMRHCSEPVHTLCSSWSAITSLPCTLGWPSEQVRNQHVSSVRTLY